MTVQLRAERLLLQSGPHVAAEKSVPEIMLTVAAAMLPVTLWSFWAFGARAVSVMAFSVGFTCLFEYLFVLLRFSHKSALGQLGNASALVSGMLLGLCLGPSSPWWLIMVGAFVAMVLGKHVYGGLGANPFNPVLVARVFLLLSFPVQMTTWFSIDRLQKAADPLLNIDGITSATPLGALKEKGWYAFLAAFERTDLFNYVLLNKGGCLGDVSVPLLVLGGLYLLYRGIITWHIPVSYLGTLVLVTGAAWIIDPAGFAPPVFHLFAGSLMLGAFFMATDMVTSPLTHKGHLIFGAGCGLITAVIRLWGAYPEGVMFAILIMNGMVPLIDRWTKPLVLGAEKSSKKRGKPA